MIKESEIDEIRKYLKKSENPLFFFDDDPDGLSSYLLLKKYTDNGKGVSVKAEPILSEKLLHKVKEISPDCIFVLDVPDITQEFVDNVHVPIIWIDHHTPKKIKGVHYYNPLLNNKNDNRPVSYWAYKITNQNIWIAAVGSISDWHIPDFIEEFKSKYPGLIPSDKKTPDEIMFNSKFGELISLFAFILKGKTGDVQRSISILSKIESPLDLLNQETSRAKYLNKKIKKLKEEYNIVLENCINQKAKGKLWLINYPQTKTSFASGISNEILFRHPDKIVMVARENKGRMKISIRSKNIKVEDKLQKAIEGIDGYGGGHELACGANISNKDFKLFLERFKSLIK